MAFLLLKMSTACVVDASSVVHSDFGWLPRSFRNCVTSYHSTAADGFIATVRSSAATAEDLMQWRQEFENRTSTHWILRRTHPHLQRLALRTDFVCQHSAFNKSALSTRTTKNCKCTATLTQKVKVISRRTKQKDQHIKVKA